MGFFQNIKDSFYIANCINQMKAEHPSTEATAEAFCRANTKLLLRERDSGETPLKAVEHTCLFMLDAPEQIMKSGNGYEAQSLIIASNLGISIVDRWPSSGLANVFKEALNEFVKFSKANEAMFRERLGVGR